MYKKMNVCYHHDIVLYMHLLLLKIKVLLVPKINEKIRICQ